ncbi:MAG: hypothetical protein WCO44_08815 [Bacteroidota bacterium]
MENNIWKKISPEIIVALILFLLLGTLGLLVNTTGDSGDSILHFLYSRGSFSHPVFFLHHWAKPLFVLVSAPFSQFGFKGIILFNCLMVALIAHVTFLTARTLKLNNAWLVYVLILGCPLFLKLTFSGLTEYLFGLVLVLSVYLAVKTRYLAAVIVVSFLPFVRSEGLIVLGVFGLFMVFRKRFTLLPWLLTGHLVYSLAGFFYYRDFFWVFTKIPYRNLGSQYGSGKIFDFIHRLNYVIEKPVFALLVIGLAALFIRFVMAKPRKAEDGGLWLVCALFLAVFIAHSLFWWLGIFNSMGLPRVLIPLVPMVALIALSGIGAVSSGLGKTGRQVLIGMILLVVSVYPFTHREKGVVFNQDMFRLPDNELIDKKVVPYLKSNTGNLSGRLLYYSHAYFSVTLDIDHFNDSLHRDLLRLSGEVPPKGAVVIWDDWFSVVENGVTLERLKNIGNLKLLKEFETHDHDRVVKFVVFIAS